MSKRKARRDIRCELQARARGETIPEPVWIPALQGHIAALAVGEQEEAVRWLRSVISAIKNALNQGWCTLEARWLNVNCEPPGWLLVLVRWLDSMSNVDRKNAIRFLRRLEDRVITTIEKI